MVYNIDEAYKNRRKTRNTYWQRSYQRKGGVKNMKKLKVYCLVLGLLFGGGINSSVLAISNNTCYTGPGGGQNNPWCLCNSIKYNCAYDNSWSEVMLCPTTRGFCGGGQDYGCTCDTRKFPVIHKCPGNKVSSCSRVKNNHKCERVASSLSQPEHHENHR